MDTSIHRRMFFIALALLLPVVFISCGGGLGTVAGGGVGGTGVGPVTGFGSVIVNGVRYDDAGIDGTNFFDDHGRDKTGLIAGMMVAVSGTINGANGTADNITVLRHVDGPMDDNGVDLATGRLKVMGQDVVVDAATVFDNIITSLADLRALQGANVNHPELEVHGCADNNGVIHATFIHKWADDRVEGRDVQVRGTLAGPPTATTFVVGRKTVDFTGVPLPACVVAGSFVEAKGTLRASDNALLATSVKLEDATGGQPSGSRAEVAGYVNRVLTPTPNASLEMIGPNGVQTVTWTTGTTAFTGGTGTDILAGVRVEVEGTRKAGGVLAATKIAIRRASNILFVTTVTSPQPTSLRLFGVAVTVNSLTQYEDSSNVDLKTFGQSNILFGESLVVSAYLDNSTGSASIVATRVERIDSITFDRHILQGPVGAKANPTLTILGVTVTTTTGTAFLQSDETPFPGAAGVEQQKAFFDAVTPGQTIVKARGTFGSGGIVANEVQIEPTLDD